jgi:hypothetical protein
LVFDIRSRLEAAALGQQGACGSKTQNLEEITTIQLVTMDITGKHVRWHSLSP